ncbi:MAG TPA: type II toxin-antitoxin system prevent-host-death family antitoxin [Rhizomicrobium sp.]|jgi:prevent-host-death family protein|nr:type II toxin-antitoxin system prevent-host-death family antitoxin [Rhizomicrobium sp.]
MRIAVTDAKGQLTELVRRAEAGEEVVLTRHGQPAVRLVSAAPKPDRAKRAAVLDAVWEAGKRKKKKGPSAARSQDFLYDEYGLPK